MTDETREGGSNLPATPYTLAVKPSTDQPDDAERQMHALSRRSFLWAGAAVLGTAGGWHWLMTRRLEGGIQWPLRRALEINENLARDYYSGQRTAPVFPAAFADEPKTNGDIGLTDDLDPSAWRLHVSGLSETAESDLRGAGAKNAEPDTEGSGSSSTPGVLLTLEMLKALPRHDIVTELKCIEGWAVIVHWTGVRFADFLKKYPPAETDSGQPGYVGVETPDGQYYVGLEMASAVHPQTLLCYAMNGQPLTVDHGAPLRLVTPVKYGIKHIKRVGRIFFSNERPRDYWAEQGYDWYAGH